MTHHCEFEAVLLETIAARRWPERAEAALRSHVDGCIACSDVAQIAAAFLEDQDAARSEAAVPPASAVWWRAQMRAREEAIRAAARPLVVVQGAATVVAAVIAIALAPAGALFVRRAVASLAAMEWWARPADASLTWVLSTAAYTTLPLLVAGLWVILAPVVVYLALDE